MSGNGGTMIVVLPQEVATAVISRAVSRGGWAVSIASVLLGIPVLVEVLGQVPLASSLAVPLAAASVTLVALVLAGWKPSTLSRLLLLAVGSASCFIYAAALLAADPSIADGREFVANRLMLPLVLIGISIARPVHGLVWSLVGYCCANIALFSASLVAGVRFSPGWGPTVTFLVFSAAYLAVAAVRARQARLVPDLARLEEETRRNDLENQFEQRAAALVHDTVLGDLTAIMNSPGPLDDRARDRLRADVATLSDPSWLRESAAGVAPDSPIDAELRNELVSLVSGFQWRGLTVDITGDSTLAVQMSPDAAEAFVAATAACLENVLRHAQTTSADLVLGSTPEGVTVMVIDNGVGFAADDVAPDRLGLRASVVRRIEAHGGSVRIWSQPGSGTSVLISMPPDSRAGSGASDVG